MASAESSKDVSSLAVNKRPFGSVREEKEEEEDDEEEDEGWTSTLNMILEEGRKVSLCTEKFKQYLSSLPAEKQIVLNCHILQLQLPLESVSSFIGIEAQHLVLLCQLTTKNGSPLMAFTRQPTSYRPLKCHVCWDHRLRFPLDYSLLQSDNLTSLSLVFVLYSEHISNGAHEGLPGRILARAELPIVSAAESIFSLGLQSLPLTFQTMSIEEGVTNVNKSRIIDRRESCLGNETDSDEQQTGKASKSSSVMAHNLQHRWGRALSEPVSASVRSSSSPGTTTFPWPSQGQLLMELNISTDPNEEKSPDEKSLLLSLQKILDRPSDVITLIEEKKLLWRYRYSLCQGLSSSRALIKILRFVVVVLEEDTCGEDAPWRKKKKEEEEEGGGDVDEIIAEVLELWKPHSQDEKGTALPILDAMKLLSGHFPHTRIRHFAIDQLKRVKDEELLFYLLQLVQLLRYEPWDPTKGPHHNELITESGTLEGQNTPIREEKTESADLQEQQQEEEEDILLLPMNMTPLAKFLIERACQGIELANGLFWYLSSEMHNRNLGCTFEKVRFSFLYALRSKSPSIYSAISAQEGWFKKIFKIHRQVVDSSGLRERKEALLRELLLEMGEVPYSIPLPLDPTVWVEGLDPFTACIYGSKTYPAFITLKLLGHHHVDSSAASSLPCSTEEEDNLLRSPTFSSSSSSSSEDVSDATYNSLETLPGQKGEEGAGFQGKTHEEEEEIFLQDCSTIPLDMSSLGVASGSYNHQHTSKLEDSKLHLHASQEEEQKEKAQQKVVIFKLKEDLRQDRLVLQMIHLMDRTLKEEEGLDLCLTVYRVLAMGPQQGILEYVPGAYTLSEILASKSTCSASSGTSSSSSKILMYFQQYAPDPSAPLGVDPQVMSTYIKSCAGYCVITHLLGVGDRHLHNMMLRPATGHFFHLDFGFILGKDPKAPLAPNLGPFRLSTAMIEGMGGKDHVNFHQFQYYCVEAYKCLRKKASLLIGLLTLMIDANLKDLSGNNSKNTTNPVAGASASGISTTTISSHHHEASRILTKMEERFRLDLSHHHQEDSQMEAKEVEKHFISLIDKALGSVTPQVIDVLHNLAVTVR